MAQELATIGAQLIDADLLAREVVEPGTAGLAEIVARFGAGILDAQGRLNRSRLGSLIFADPHAREDLNAIVHPRVRELAVERETMVPMGDIVVHIIPLLVETGQQETFDEVVVVDVAEATQLARLITRDGLDPRSARARIAAQTSRAQRLAAATRIIDNDGPWCRTRRAIHLLWKSLRRRGVQRGNGILLA